MDTPPVAVGGVTVVTETLAELSQQQVNAAIASVDPQQLRGLIDELEDEVTQLSQLSEEQSTVAERLRAKSLNATRVVTRYAEMASTNDREEHEDMQVMTQRYEVQVGDLKARARRGP